MFSFSRPLEVQIHAVDTLATPGAAGEHTVTFSRAKRSSSRTQLNQQLGSSKALGILWSSVDPSLPNRRTQQ